MTAILKDEQGRVARFLLRPQPQLGPSRTVALTGARRLAPRRLRAAEGWLAEQRAIWERRLDQLDDYLDEMEETDNG